MECIDNFGLLGLRLVASPSLVGAVAGAESSQLINGEDEWDFDSDAVLTIVGCGCGKLEYQISII